MLSSAWLTEAGSCRKPRSSGRQRRLWNGTCNEEQAMCVDFDRHGDRADNSTVDTISWQVGWVDSRHGQHSPAWANRSAMKEEQSGRIHSMQAMRASDGDDSSKQCEPGS